MEQQAGGQKRRRWFGGGEVIGLGKNYIFLINTGTGLCSGSNSTAVKCIGFHTVS